MKKNKVLNKASKATAIKKSSAKQIVEPVRSMKKKSTVSAKRLDIIDLILQDHKPLKKLIEVLKDSEVNFPEKKFTFQEFAPLLLLHADSEEKSLYIRMKNEKKLRMQSFEGDVEHGLAAQLIEEIQNMGGDEDLWMAKVKVLAELVEHHIIEEETEMLKDVRKEFDAVTRYVIGQEYTNLKNDYTSAPNDYTSDKLQKPTEIRAH